MSLVRFSNNVPGLFDRFFENDLFDWSTRNYSDTNTSIPSVNIKEDNEEFEVELAAPGFKKDDFRIEINNNALSISSEKKMENETKNGQQYTRKEFSYQSFSRTFTLPNSTEGDKISAKYENGILKIVIPKKEEAKPKPMRQIEIK